MRYNTLECDTVQYNTYGVGVNNLILQFVSISRASVGIGGYPSLFQFRPQIFDDIQISIVHGMVILLEEQCSFGKTFSGGGKEYIFQNVLYHSGSQSNSLVFEVKLDIPTISPADNGIIADRVTPQGCLKKNKERKSKPLRNALATLKNLSPSVNEKFLQYVSGLKYVPPCIVEDVFVELDSIAPNHNQLTRFLDYVLQNYRVITEKQTDVTKIIIVLRLNYGGNIKVMNYHYWSTLKNCTLIPTHRTVDKQHTGTITGQCALKVVVITEDVQNVHLLLEYRPHIDVSLTCEHDPKLRSIAYVLRTCHNSIPKGFQIRLLVEKKLPTEECTGRNGERERSSDYDDYFDYDVYYDYYDSNYDYYDSYYDYYDSNYDYYDSYYDYYDSYYDYYDSYYDYYDYNDQDDYYDYDSNYDYYDSNYDYYDSYYDYYDYNDQDDYYDYDSNYDYYDSYYDYYDSNYDYYDSYYDYYDSYYDYYDYNDQDDYYDYDSNYDYYDSYYDYYDYNDQDDYYDYDSNYDYYDSYYDCYDYNDQDDYYDYDSNYDYYDSYYDYYDYNDQDDYYDYDSNYDYYDSYYDYYDYNDQDDYYDYDSNYDYYDSNYDYYDSNYDYYGSNYDYYD
ncbi:hypothetical protein ANN_06694 [Periplaneta americana]|uniref:Uncharacterized protein n=1 Tax=Periplaneta americana TaxID=6978 RepID=A0ABQ8TE86_PERAM|nr:hypothetical protein ANN_06694 [Periplaneta americana]